MIFTVHWDYPAERVLLSHIPWPVSGEVARALYRFAAERAPRLTSGRYGLRVSGYEVAFRVDARAGTVLVLYVYKTS